MSDWVHIEPPAPRLTPVQERIREMMRAGKTFRQICVALMMRSDHLRDEIYEIRKYEAIMGEKKRLTDEQKAAIIDMRQAGKPYKEISETVGCAKQTAVNVWNAYVRTPEKRTGINKEFDDAVNEMIEEMHAEETAEPEEIEQVTEPVVMTEEHTAAVPDAVIRAVEDKITELQTMIRDNTERIESLKQHNKKFSERIGILECWLKEVQT